MIVCFRLAGPARLRPGPKRDLLPILAEERYLREIELPPYRGPHPRSYRHGAGSFGRRRPVFIEPGQAARAELLLPQPTEPAHALADVLHLGPPRASGRLESNRCSCFKRRILPEEAQRVRDPGAGPRPRKSPSGYYPAWGPPVRCSVGWSTRRA